MSSYDEAKLAAEIYISLLTEQRERRQRLQDELLDADPTHIDLTLLEKRHDRQAN